MQPITIGTKASASVQVTEAQLAVTVGSGSLRVFATPMLAALMEKTACAAVAEFLEDGETTVGTALDLAHTAATPEGMTVTATAEITAVSGREITFAITASDEVGEVGHCTHKRILYEESCCKERISIKAGFIQNELKKTCSVFCGAGLFCNKKTPG